MDLSAEALKFSQWLHEANKAELASCIRYYYENNTARDLEKLYFYADKLRQLYYERKVFFRGLIEFSNHCCNDCYYCGLRKSNTKVKRYRLTQAEILTCCASGYKQGLRTFVLQSGEDLRLSDKYLCHLVSSIKDEFPDCALTLSVGERSRDSYLKLYKAGADRYLLRHETADEVNYSHLHPPRLNLLQRKRCLYDLKEIGYQVGAGFMVDSPGQSFETLAEDLIFLRELQPQMIGLGPFIPHRDTPFADYLEPGSRHSLILLSLVRILLPKGLIPATTALNTLAPNERIKGLQAGANVLMPNLSPVIYRNDYNLYDNKLSDGKEAAEHLASLTAQLEEVGFEPDFSRGDHIDFSSQFSR
ncbi:MAG TPA: [FeFe] hydrogenase H-cluster radical SAM maturase HydE [Clostridiaceae bacterium]|nr:[FeFe] hydrogenase H-cluster radical SAM maturase HydE [Clostridiaceae bacterium]